MAGLYKFKEIQKVEQSKSLVDVVLSRTQRKTPTEVHPQFKIQRIRSFYMRKVKYCQTTFNEKLSAILDQFPRIDDIHPFYGDLCNVLYDRDHYKLALGQVNSVRGIVDKVGKDYVRLLKFADTLYKCKSLKRAGMGRMATAILKLKASLAFLEEVRQHMSRLPAINPSTRTLLVTGYPNVGKSSFMNLVTNANVDVQPYAFTTKSLFVGHLDYNYVRWQVIDTPGILDHPLEDRNTIEMTAITALAHIKATLLFLIDVSEECGWTIKQQVALFESILPLFKGKPVLIVLNKTDVQKVADLPEADMALLKSMEKMCEGQIEGQLLMMETSCMTQDGVDAARNKACDLLLNMRVEQKVKAGKVESILQRITVTKVPQRKDRPAHVPERVLKVRAAKALEKGADSDEEMEAMKTERDMMEEGGGAGVYATDVKKLYLLQEDEWKYDMVPEIMDGKNVAQFIDVDIERKLEELEKEEELLLAQELEGIDEEEEKLWAVTQGKIANLHEKRKQRQYDNKLEKASSKVVVPRKRQRDLAEVEKNLDELGKPSAAIRARSKPKRRKTEDPEIDEEAIRRVKSTNEQGLPNEADRQKSEHLRRVTQKQSYQKENKKGDADRSIADKRPKHLFSGKRGIGTKDWR